MNKNINTVVEPTEEELDGVVGGIKPQLVVDITMPDVLSVEHILPTVQLGSMAQLASAHD